MAKELGPTFGEEIMAADLGGLPFAWGATDETITGRENLTAEQNTTLDGVIAAHDPTKQAVPDATPSTELLYEHENRIRALEGVPPLSLAEIAEKVMTTKKP